MHLLTVTCSVYHIENRKNCMCSLHCMHACT